MVLMMINYWAGARTAAGIASETVRSDTVAGALAEVVRRHPDPSFARVVRASTVLVDGVALRGPDLGRLLERAVEVEILPPFAGGSGSQDDVVSLAGVAAMATIALAVPATASAADSTTGKSTVTTSDTTFTPAKPPTGQANNWEW